MWPGLCGLALLQCLASLVPDLAAWRLLLARQLRLACRENASHMLQANAIPSI